jgi:hypothetical protein
MNTVIANIILDRIQNAGFEWVDKTAGLVRPITFVKGKTSRTLPIAANVSDPLNCTDDVIQALLPEEKYKSVLFIEGDQFPELVKSPIGDSYRSKLRIVVWLNCSKLGGGAGCGDFAAKAITELLQNPRKYDADPLKSIKHKVVGGLIRGKDIFGKYTLSEEKSMFLHFPFDFFSLDVETEYYAPAGCFDGLTEDQTACWTPGSDGRRLHPNQFTCEQLQDATHGLTAEQLGPNCLDCSGDGGDCDPLGYDLHNSEDTVLLSGVITDPCGGTLELTAPDATYDLKDEDGQTLSSGSIPSQVNAVVTAPSATVLRDGSPYGTVLSGGSIDVESATCPTPSSTVQLKDSVGVDIGIPLEVPYNSTNLPIPVPDSVLTKPDATLLNLQATAPFDIRTLRSGIVYQRGDAHWSGQLTSYQAFDEAAIYAAGFFDITRPLYPTHFAELGANFVTLSENNLHGNLNRFTDRNGLQVYSDGIIRDHLTSYEWYYPIVAANNWTTAVSQCAALVVGGDSDWYLPPMGVLDSIVNNNGGVLLNYAPFNIVISIGLWSSTTTPTATTQALPLLSNGAFQSYNKGTSTLRWVAVRRFL